MAAGLRGRNGSWGCSRRGGEGVTTEVVMVATVEVEVERVGRGHTVDGVVTSIVEVETR